MRHVETFSKPLKPTSQCAGRTIVLTTFRDGQGLAGMNVLHFGRICCRKLAECEIQGGSTSPKVKISKFGVVGAKILSAITRLKRAPLYQGDRERAKLHSAHFQACFELDFSL